jgi:magnesium-transporting ATPase (P-type)
MMVFIIGFIQGLAFFIIGMIKGRTFVDSLCNGFVLVLIANIPQGLPTTVSFTLNLVAKRMVA